MIIFFNVALWGIAMGMIVYQTNYNIKHSMFHILLGAQVLLATIFTLIYV